jgi:mannose-6-phosphate isomerase-like protein (cupin superfamily)
MRVVNLSDSFKQISEYWSPHIVGELNGQYVKIAKLKGNFVWHKHQDEDEMFLVMRGNLSIHLKDNTLKLTEGEFAIIPKGIDHCPAATEECEVLLFEPKSTLNTGNTNNDFTKVNLPSI